MHRKDNNVEDIVSFRFPIGLNTEIKQCVLQKLEEIKASEGKNCVYKYGNYEYKVPHFNHVITVFTDIKMVGIWDTLLDKSYEKTMIFAGLLFEFEQLFQEGLLFIDEQKQKIQSYNKQIHLSEQLLEEHGKHTLDNYNKHLQIRLIDHIAKTKDKIQSLETKLKDEVYFKNGFWPLTRKNTMENALPIFFIRKIYHFFITEYGEPMHAYIHEIVEVIFKNGFHQNQVIKHCKRMHRLFSELSPP